MTIFFLLRVKCRVVLFYLMRVRLFFAHINLGLCRFLAGHFEAHAIFYAHKLISTIDGWFSANTFHFMRLNADLWNGFCSQSLFFLLAFAVKWKLKRSVTFDADQVKIKLYHVDAALNCETWNHQRDEEKSDRTQNWPPKVKLVRKGVRRLKIYKTSNCTL